MKLAIVGGGPVGLFLSLELCKNIQELDTIDLFEKSKWPKDKTCGQGIMPTGVNLLSLNNINFNDNEDCFALKGVRYIDDSVEVEGDMVEPILGVERKVLSQKLYEQVSKKSKINLYPHHLVDSIEMLQREYDYFFLCDGLNSRLRNDLGLTRKKHFMPRMGARVHFLQAPWSDRVEVYWSHGVEAYVTPVNQNKIEIAFLWYKEKIKLKSDLEKQLMSYFPELEIKLKQDQNAGDFIGYGPFNVRSKSIKYKNIFLVGDAYCFLDGITGEGISLGFRSAKIIAKHFKKFSFLQHFKIYLLYFNYGFWVYSALVLSRFPKFRKTVFKVFLKKTKIFNLILQLNDL